MKQLKLGMVVHACNPSHLEGGGRRIENLRLAWTKLARPYIRNNINKRLRAWFKWWSML
jgi:hypothetical protein